MKHKNTAGEPGGVFVRRWANWSLSRRLSAPMQSLEHKITQHVQNQIDSNVDTGPAEVALAGGVFLFGLDAFGGKKAAHTAENEPQRSE